MIQKVFNPTTFLGGGIHLLPWLNPAWFFLLPLQKLFRNNLFLTKIFDQQIFWNSRLTLPPRLTLTWPPKKIWPTNLFTKHFCLTKSLFDKYFLRKLFMTKIILTNIFFDQIFFLPTFFLPTFFYQHFFYQNIFRQDFFLDPNFFLTKILLTKNFFDQNIV